MRGIIGLLIIGFSPILYFGPAIIAWWRKHPSLPGIMVLNLFLGWTGIGWVGALVWAILKPEAPVRRLSDDSW